MTTSGLRRIAFGLGFSPFKAFKVKLINVIKGSSMIIDPTMATKDNNFIFVPGHRMVGSRFRSTNFGHRILGDAS
jgi:hypothetical protein